MEQSPAAPSAIHRRLDNLFGKRWFFGATAAGILIVYLVLSFAAAATKRPLGDEAWMANPALDLLTRGTTGLTVSDTPGLNTYNYYWLPFPFLVHAACYKLFGFSVLTMRSVSITVGFVALIACMILVFKVTGKRNVALLAAFLLAVDYLFEFTAADGRPDMLSGGFSLSALAAYVLLRERNLNWAVLASPS